MANELQINAATGTPQRVDARDVDYSGTTRCREIVIPDGRGADPTFWCLSSNLTATASRFQFVLYNNNATAVVRVKRLALLPVSTVAVAGAFSGPWTLRVRRGPTTDPTGTGGITIQTFDSADSLPSSITAFSNPSTSPAGGTTHDYIQVVPPCEELIGTATTVNSTTNAFTARGGTILYQSLDNDWGKPLTLRQDQCLELQQDATAGVLTAYQVHCVFTAF